MKSNLPILLCQVEEHAITVTRYGKPAIHVPKGSLSAELIEALLIRNVALLGTDKSWYTWVKAALNSRGKAVVCLQAVPVGTNLEELISDPVVLFAGGWRH